jgi:hypothetical protein
LWNSKHPHHQWLEQFLVEVLTMVVPEAGAKDSAWKRTWNR